MPLHPARTIAATDHRCCHGRGQSLESGRSLGSLRPVGGFKATAYHLSRNLPRSKRVSVCLPRTNVLRLRIGPTHISTPLPKPPTFTWSPSIRRCVKRAQTSCYFNRWTGNWADRLAGARRTNSCIAGKSVTLRPRVQFHFRHREIFDEESITCRRTSVRNLLISRTTNLLPTGPSSAQFPCGANPWAPAHSMTAVQRARQCLKRNRPAFTEIPRLLLRGSSSPRGHQLSL